MIPLTSNNLGDSLARILCLGTVAHLYADEAEASRCAKEGDHARRQAEGGGARSSFARHLPPRIFSLSAPAAAAACRSGAMPCAVAESSAAVLAFSQAERLQLEEIMGEAQSPDDETTPPRLAGPAPPSPLSFPLHSPPTPKAGMALKIGETPVWNEGNTPVKGPKPASNLGSLAEKKDY